MICGFPGLPFFAFENIKAGEELAWDYQYEIGSVADKQIQCYCRSSSCRKRML